MVDPKSTKYYPWSPYSYCFNNPLRYIDSNGEDGWDIVAGYGIGFITNIIPGTGALRDSYTPNDPSDYNNALQGVDNASMAAGAAMIASGGSAMAAGEGTVALGAVAAVATGGVATPTVVIGGTIQTAGATTAAAGVMMMSNASQNKQAGYDRGGKGTQGSKSKEGEYSKEPPGKLTKMKGGQGWKDSKGNIWKRDMKHKDHYDVTNPKSGKK